MAARTGLDWFASEVDRYAAMINAPADYLPTFGYSQDHARPHIEFDGARFHFVVVERGGELERRSADDPTEILYRAFECVTFGMACAYEVHHRREGEDFRRQLFEVQVRLMKQLSDSWGQRLQDRLNEVLSRHPYTDGVDRPKRDIHSL